MSNLTDREWESWHHEVTSVRDLPYSVVTPRRGWRAALYVDFWQNVFYDFVRAALMVVIAELLGIVIVGLAYVILLLFNEVQGLT